jgi:hypothetical protein
MYRYKAIKKCLAAAIFILPVLALVCGGSTDPMLEIETITIIENRLFASTSENSIRSYDIAKQKWDSTTAIDDQLRSICKSDRDILVHGSYGGIKQLSENGEVKSILSKDVIQRLSNQRMGVHTLVGAVDENVYLIARQHIEESANRQYRGVSYNIEDNKVSNWHLAGYPDQIVVGYLKENAYTWFFCLDGAGKEQKQVNPLGKLSVIRKSKTDNAFEKFELGVEAWGISVVDSPDKIYIFMRTPIKASAYETRLYAFSKSVLKFDFEATFENMSIYSVPNQYLQKSDEFVWIYHWNDHRLSRLSIDDYRIIPFTISEKLNNRHLRYPSYTPPIIYSDGYVWKGVLLHEDGPFRCGMSFSPYIVKIADSGSDYELIHVSPFPKEAVSNLFHSFICRFNPLPPG